MFKRLLTFAKDPTSINILINSLGNYFNIGFVVIIFFIMVQKLTPVEYGVYSVLFGLSYLLAQILEFGTTATIYSSVPALYQTNERKLYQFIKSTLFYQTLFSVIIVGVLIVLFPWLDTVFFKTGSDPWVLVLTSGTIIMFVWQNFLTNILFAAKRFARANIYLNLANVVKVVVIATLAYTHTLTIPTVIIAYGYVGPIVFFLLFLAKNYERLPSFSAAAIRKDELKFGYTMTYFVASQFYNMGIRMDLFLLSYFMLGAQIGYYASAQKIILSIIATIVSISQVLSPQFATVHTKKEVWSSIKKGFMYMAFPASIFVALFFTPRFVFDLLFPESYAPVIDAAHALALPFVLNAFGTVLMLFLLYTVKKPIYILWSNIAFFIIVTAGSYALIPHMGMLGPPIAIAGAFLAADAILLVASIKEYRSLPNVHT
jgi:O-antigen/teichoic acid export membrane protein